MASEVYADVSGTIPPQAQACPGLCPLCQCFPKPGFQTTCVKITEGNADSWALPQTYRIWISSRWRRNLHIIWAPQVILIHPSLRTSDADSGAGFQPGIPKDICLVEQFLQNRRGELLPFTEAWHNQNLPDWFSWCGMKRTTECSDCFRSFLSEISRSAFCKQWDSLLRQPTGQCS